MEDGNRKRRANNGSNAGGRARPEETDLVVQNSEDHEEVEGTIVRKDNDLEVERVEEDEVSEPVERDSKHGNNEPVGGEQEPAEERLEHNNVVEADVQRAAAMFPDIGATLGLKIMTVWDEATAARVKMNKEGLSSELLKKGEVLKNYRAQAFFPSPDGKQLICYDFSVELLQQPGPSSVVDTASRENPAADVPNNTEKRILVVRLCINYNPQNCEPVLVAVPEGSNQQSARERISLPPCAAVPSTSYNVVPDVNTEDSDKSEEM